MPVFTGKIVSSTGKKKTGKIIYSVAFGFRSNINLGELYEFSQASCGALCVGGGPVQTARMQASGRSGGVN